MATLKTSANRPMTARRQKDPVNRVVAFGHEAVILDNVSREARPSGAFYTLYLTDDGVSKLRQNATDATIMEQRDDWIRARNEPSLFLLTRNRLLQLPNRKRSMR